MWIFIFCLLSSGGAHAQSLEWGGGFQVYFMPGTVLETNQLSSYNGPETSAEKVFAILPTIGASLSANFPVLERQGFSFGIAPGYTVNGMIRSGGFFVGGRGDAMLTWRKGSFASYSNFREDERFLGIGAGYSFYSVLNITELYSDKIFFARPAAFIETGIDHHKIKLFVQLLPYKSIYPSYTGGIPKITYWQFGFTWEKYLYFLDR